MGVASGDMDRGWAWLVLIASSLIHVMVFGVAWSTGVYYIIFLETFGESKSVTAWAGSMTTATLYATGPVAGMLTNKYGFRRVIIVGGLMSSTGLCLTYFAQSIFHIFFSLGVLTGAGLGLVIIAALATLPCYFDKKISIAAGIAASGVGLGNVIYPMFIRWLIQMYDWRQSFLILGALTLNICALGVLMRPVEPPDSKVKKPILDMSPFKNKGYLMLCLNVFLYCCGISTVYVHVAALGEYKGNSPDYSALLLSGIGIANVIGRFSYGVIAHHSTLNVFILYGFSFCVSGMCVMMIPLVENYELLMTFSALFGLLSGCLGTLMVQILVDLLGLESFANGYGCLLLFMSVGQISGASGAGALCDATNSYTMAFLIGGAICILSALVIIYPYIYVKYHPRPYLDDLDTEKVVLPTSNGVNGVIPGHYPSRNELSHAVPSLESLTLCKHVLDMQNSTHSLNRNKEANNQKKRSKKHYLPVHKDTLALQCSMSTKTI